VYEPLSMRLLRSAVSSRSQGSPSVRKMFDFASSLPSYAYRFPQLPANATVQNDVYSSRTGIAVVMYNTLTVGGDSLAAKRGRLKQVPLPFLTIQNAVA